MKCNDQVTFIYHFMTKTKHVKIWGIRLRFYDNFYKINISEKIAHQEWQQKSKKSKILKIMLYTFFFNSDKRKFVKEMKRSLFA
jgi:hypothetical protein